MGKALVSVVMPVHSPRPEHLKESIRSILGQTYDHLELLILYDSSGTSVDEAVSGILEECQYDERVKVLAAPARRGFVQSLNIGLEKARGSYVARQDGDDVSSRFRIEDCVAILDDNKAWIVGTWAYLIDECGLLKGYLTPPVDHRKIRRLMLWSNPFVSSSVVFKRELIDRVGNYDASLFGAEDYDFALRCAGAGYALRNIPEFLTCIRQTPESITRGRSWYLARWAALRARYLATTRHGFTSVPDFLFLFGSTLRGPVIPPIANRSRVLLTWYTSKLHGRAFATRPMLERLPGKDDFRQRS